MPYFRPLPVLTLLSLPALVLLIALGAWQTQRMGWKAERIAAFEARGEVTGFRAALCSGFDGPFGPSVTGPVPLTGETLRYYTLRGEPGWARIGVMPVEACEPGDPPRLLFVETAFETLIGGERTAVRRWRIEGLPQAGAFASGNDPDTNQWYRFDRTEMAASLGVDEARVADVWARADLGLPESLARTPPSRHLGYALTWYGLALALIGVYVAFHAARGRLRLK